MALTYPLSLAQFADKLNIDKVTWRLKEQQQITGLGSGEILAADMAPARVEAQVDLNPMYHEDAAAVQALVEALDGSIGTFYLHSPQKAYPAAYPNGDFWPGESFANRLINPGFETGVLTPWVPSTGVTAYNTGAHSGTYCMLLDKGAAGAGAGTQREAWQLVDGIEAGKQYNLGAWLVGAAPAAAGANLRIQWRNAANGIITTSNIVTNAAYPTTWQYMSGSAVAPALATRALIYVVFSVGGAAQHLLVDDVSFTRYETFNGANAQIASLSGNNKEMSLSALPFGYKLSGGDLLSFDYGTNPVRRALHRVILPVTASGSGVSPTFEVRPYIRPGATVGLSVTLVKAAAKVRMIPDSFNPGTNDADGITRGMSFQVRQTL